MAMHIYRHADMISVVFNIGKNSSKITTMGDHFRMFKDDKHTLATLRYNGKVVAQQRVGRNHPFVIFGPDHKEYTQEFKDTDHVNIWPHGNA